MKDGYLYVGAFVPAENLREHLSPTLARPVRHPHVTFRYKPESVDESLFGTSIPFQVIGYGCDGENEGLEVIPVCEDGPLIQQLAAIAHPHITLSVSPSGRARNSGTLAFHPLKPFLLPAVYGGWHKRNGLVLTPPNRADIPKIGNPEKMNERVVL